MPIIDEEAIANAIDKVGPSVCTVGVLQLIQQGLFSAVPLQGMGSGLVIDKQGHILTNHHIVEEAEKVEVLLHDGKKFQAKVLGSDPSSDIAVIRIQPNGETLLPAELGDSDRLRVGQLAIAIGNPFGFFLRGPTATVGVISAVKRHIHMEGKMYEDLLQTDAAINPGNSGGPLVDTSGRVIGINTAMIPYAQGIGFSIAINTAKSIAQDIIQHGRVLRPWLGIAGLTVNKSVAAYYGLPVDHGAMIAQMVSGGPAEHAGLEAGDIITEVEGVRIDSVEELQDRLRSRKVGDSVSIAFQRGRAKNQVRIRLRETPYRETLAE